MSIFNKIKLSDILTAIEKSNHKDYLLIDAEYIGSAEDNLTGLEINGKTVIKYLGTGATGNYMWLVICSNCDRLSILEDKSLKIVRDSSKCKYCKNLKHYDAGSKLYRVWYRLVKNLTDDTREEYYINKLKGITICKEWLDFTNFKNDMEGTYLPRSSIKLNRGCYEYSKKNVRWVDMGYNITSRNAKKRAEGS